MRRFILVLLVCSLFPLAAVVEGADSVAEEAASVPEGATVIKEERKPVKKKKAKKAKKKAVADLPRVNADVRNLRVGQEGDQAVATYDLVSSGGEGVAEVTVAIIIDGKRRTSDQLSLSGDFGRDVRTGPGKRIIWNAMTDLPKGFDGELKWDVVTVGNLPGGEIKVIPIMKIEGPTYDETADFILRRYPQYSSGKYLWEPKEWSERCLLKINYVNSNGDATPVITPFARMVSITAKEEPENNRNLLLVTYDKGEQQWWYFTDKILSEKFYKAFHHMRKLCGAKDDPF